VTALALAGPAGADPIAFDHAPLSNIVAQLSQQYGVNIVLKGSLAQNPSRAVTLRVGDPGTTPTRLQAMNALANAAGVDFQKGFVVSKIAADDVPPPVKIDSNGYVVFKDKTVSAKDAIAEVATTDNATIQVSDDVAGNVTFTKSTLRTADAAAEIARQTHTRWRVYYALTPRSMGLRGKVVDHSNDGQAIVELPFTYYGSKSGPAATGDDTVTAPPNTPQNPALGVGPDNNPGVVFNGPVPGGGLAQVGGGTSVIPYSYVSPFTYGYGQMPFTYGNSYNYNGYGAPYQSQYGYFGGSPYGGYPNGGISIYPGTGGYGPFGGYGAPVTF
jgi:hypothetical protein